MSLNQDRINGNWDKVNLNFTPYTPLAYYRKGEIHLCFFLIKPEVATWEGIVFTNTNAASGAGKQVKGSGIKGLSFINFNAIKMRPQPWDREGWVIPVQAEVLVPNTIPLDFVEEVVFVSDASRKEVIRLWGDYPHPPFGVKKRLFANGPQLHDPIIFPYLELALLSDQEINEDNLDQAFVHKDSFVKNGHNKITLLLHVHAFVGSTAKVVWSDGVKVSSTKFETRESYYFWPDAKLSLFPSGSNFVDFYIDDIRWIRLPFTVKG